MRYLIILLFLSGCATTDFLNKENKADWNHTNKEQVSELRRESGGRIELNEISDVGHRIKAQELGIPYVDYLHLVNNNKNKVVKSRIKLNHSNNE